MLRTPLTFAFVLTAGLTGCTTVAPELPETQTAQPAAPRSGSSADSRITMDQANALYAACVDWVVDGKAPSEAWLRSNGFVPDKGEWRRTALRSNPLKGPGIATAVRFDQSGCNIGHIQEGGNASYVGSAIGKMLIARGFTQTGRAVLGGIFTRGDVKVKLTGASNRLTTGITITRAK